jgi:hypothetical protein
MRFEEEQGSRHAFPSPNVQVHVRVRVPDL